MTSVPPCDLTAREAAARLANGSLTAEVLARSCLERISAREAEVQAWQAIDPDLVLAKARAADAAGRPGPLHGLPIGVKDLMATVDLPTTCGSSIYEGARLPFDAACVALARLAGGIVMGKTVTTEFATYQPGKTRNPHDRARTPGGSSSGSAAAVAAGMVPLALGTQTAGSVIRPAAYCGVVGFKPTHGLIETAGVKALAPALDTVGVFARTVADAAFLVETLTGLDLSVNTRPTVKLCRSPAWEAAEPEMIDAWNRLESRLGLETLELPPIFADAIAAQERIMAYQAFRALAHEWRAHRDQLSLPLQALLDEGRRVSRNRHEADLALMQRVKAIFSGSLMDDAVILTPGAPGVPPPGDQGTGNPIMNRLWTLLGGPCITVPGLASPDGLPLGVQVVAPPGQDATAVAAAAWLERRIIKRPGRPTI